MGQIFQRLTSEFSPRSMGVVAWLLLGVVAATPSATAFGQTEESEQPIAHEARKNTKEPIFRVSKINNLDPANATATTVVPNNASLVAEPPATAIVVDPAPAVAVDPATPIPDSASSTPPIMIPNMESSGTPNSANPNVASLAPHPLDRALETAKSALADMRANVHDYTAIMVKRERIADRISEPDLIQIKVRCPRQTPTTNTPFSIYMKFLRPKPSAGREVIWVDGVNDGNLCVHEGKGLISLKTLNLDPTGWIAMQGNRYPIYEAGLENLIQKLIEKAERDRNAGPCEVIYRDNAEVLHRPCDLIEVIHAECRAPYDFHKAQVFIDQELGLPIRYAAYGWPTTPGGEPPLNEEYTYANIKVNVGYTDDDFSPENPAYNYPGR